MLTHVANVVKLINVRALPLQNEPQHLNFRNQP